MLPEDVVRLPAGWYPDPTGLPQLRWWDNHAWTQHTTAARQPLIVQESRLAWADDLPTRRERREREREDQGEDDALPPTTQTLRELAPPSGEDEPADEPAPVGAAAPVTADEATTTVDAAAPTAGLATGFGTTPGNETSPGKEAAPSDEPDWSAVSVPGGDGSGGETTIVIPPHDSAADDEDDDVVDDRIAPPRIPVDAPAPTPTPATASAPTPPPTVVPTPAAAPSPTPAAAASPPPAVPEAAAAAAEAAARATASSTTTAATAPDPGADAMAPEAYEPVSATGHAARASRGDAAATPNTGLPPASEFSSFAEDDAASTAVTTAPAAPVGPATGSATITASAAEPQAVAQQAAPPIAPAAGGPLAAAVTAPAVAMSVPVAALSTPALSAPALSAPALSAPTASVPRARATAVGAPATAHFDQIVNQTPLGSGVGVAGTALVPSTHIGTGPAWVIALVPLLQLVLSLLIVTGFGSTINLQIVVPSIAGVLYLLVIVLAITDRAMLRRAGHPGSASWAWAFLTAPVYLIARAISLSRISGRGFTPVLVWAVLGLLQLGSILAVPGLLISAAPTVFSAQAQQSIIADATAIGARLDVTCPATPPILIAQQFTCKATSTSGDKYDVVVSLQRVNGWIDWRVDDWGIYTLSR